MSYGTHGTDALAEKGVFILQHGSCAISIQFFQLEEMEVILVVGKIKSTLCLLMALLMAR